MYNKLKINSNINIMHLNSQHNFIQELTNDYRQKYELRVLFFDYKTLK